MCSSLLAADDVRARPLSTWTADLITVGLGLLFMVGVLIDGWAHFHIRLFETFFTPWHALLYSGFLLSAGWLFLRIVHHQRHGWAGLKAVPRGYELSFVGMIVFVLSGLADMLWHIALGVETDLAAALSPTHLGLYTGGALFLSGPFCAAWIADTCDCPSSFVHWIPRLLSLAASMTALSYMHAYLWAFSQVWPLRDGLNAYAASPDVLSVLRPVADGRGLASIVVTNALVLAPMMFVLLRWRPPFGSMALIFTVVSILMSIQPGVSLGTLLTVLRTLASGLLIDAVIQRLDPRPGRPWAYRVFAVVAPLVIWSLYFLGASLHWGLAWSVELWLGAIILSALGGLGLSVLMVPPLTPETRGRPQ